MSGTRKNPGRLVLGREEFKPSVLVVTEWDPRHRPVRVRFIYPDEPDGPPEGQEYHLSYAIARSMPRRHR